MDGAFFGPYLVENSIMSPLLRLFHFTAILEGWSSLLLILVAVPLKYLADWEMGVKALGMPHGVLFIAFNLFVALYFFRGKLSFKQSAWGFISSIFPGGTFLFDRTIKKLADGVDA